MGTSPTPSTLASVLGVKAAGEALALQEDLLGEPTSTTILEVIKRHLLSRESFVQQPDHRVP